MSLERALQHLQGHGLADRVMLFEVSSATVELAAQAVGCAPERIAKSLTFEGTREDDTIMVLAAGDAKVDNAKFKAFFERKAKMLEFSQVEMRVGHAVGGVCPFGVESGVRVYLDESLRRFDFVYPAAGTAASAVELTCDELALAAESRDWVDVCKGWSA